MTRISVMKRGQVWIETVIYTLIGLSIMGLALGFIVPRLNQSKNTLIVEQTIDSLRVLDRTIGEVRAAPGNRRAVEFSMKQGSLYFDGTKKTGDLTTTTKEEIIFVLDNFNKPYSEPGVEITNGRLLINTSENAPYSVELRLVYTVDVYSNDNPPVLQRKQLIDLKYEGEDKVVKFNAASTPYTFFITNTGPDAKCISDCGSPGTSDCIANCKEVINVMLPSR